MTEREGHDPATGEDRVLRGFLLAGVPAYAYRVAPGPDGHYAVECPRLQELAGYADSDLEPTLSG